jgi:hypothetical protein
MPEETKQEEMVKRVVAVVNNERLLTDLPADLKQKFTELQKKVDILSKPYKKLKEDYLSLISRHSLVLENNKKVVAWFDEVYPLWRDGSLDAPAFMCQDIQALKKIVDDMRELKS